MTRIFRNEEVERIAESRLMEFENRHGKFASPCIPVDEIIEDCGLSILYEKIEERQGEKILGGLNVQEKIIVINESHMQLFNEKPGLERSTKAHELGHWDIFVAKNQNNTDSLFGFCQDLGGLSYRNSVSGKVISVLLDAWTDQDIYQAYKIATAKKDHPNVASAVDRYASCLLMPKRIISSYAEEGNLTNWKVLYKIADTLGVTISALCVRLERLRLVYIKDKKLYRTKEEITGQNIFKFN